VLRQSGTQIALKGVTYGNGLFVAVGYSDAGRVNILTSTGGVDWVQPQSGTMNWLSSIACGNGQFVAVGWAGTIVTSADGENWVNRRSGTQNILHGIAYGNGEFVVARKTDYFALSSTILTSVDAVNWIQNDLGDDIEAIAYGKRQFVAVGWYGAIQTSADGQNWVGRLSGTRNGFIGIAYGEGRFIAVGRGASILQSGSIFTLTITPGANTGLLSLSLEGLTGPGYTIQTSTDLISWRNLTNITGTQTGSVTLELPTAGSDRAFYRALEP